MPVTPKRVQNGFGLTKGALLGRHKVLSYLDSHVSLLVVSELETRTDREPSVWHWDVSSFELPSLCLAVVDSPLTGERSRITISTSK